MCELRRKRRSSDDDKNWSLDPSSDFYISPAVPRVRPVIILPPTIILLARCVRWNREKGKKGRKKTEPVLKFSDARIWCGSFVREKKKWSLVAVDIVGNIVAADSRDKVLIFNLTRIAVVSRLISRLLESRAASPRVVSSLDFVSEIVLLLIDFSIDNKR